MSRPGPLTVGAAALVVAAVGCGGNGGSPEGRDITVFAAASLTDAFAELAAAFEAGNPGTEVELHLAGSSSLAAQIEEGAPADVFASADPAQMEVVVRAGATQGEPRPFAANTLQIAVPAGNPGGVTGVEDLARDELLVGLCADGVPCGRLARQVLDRAGVTPAIDTEEPDVRALLTKLESGELDAGIVYETDVRARAGGVEGVAIPANLNVVTTYPLVALADSGAPDVATAFVAFVLSDEGFAVLERFGFRAP